MKNLYLLLALGVFFLVSSCKTDKSYTLTYVYDYENILSDEEKLQLDQLFVEHEQKTTNEIVLVTVGDYAESENIDLYTEDFRAKHLIGKAEKNNGVLIVFSSKNSEVRITPGTGLLKMDEEGMTKHLIDEVMIPRFEEEAYFQGLLEGSQEMIEYLEK
jgi:uncharacterized protein